MREQEIKELNKAIKGEHMAIETFDHFIQDIDNQTIDQTFQKMQEKHKEQELLLAKQVQNMGGNPVNTAGFAGVMAEIKNRISPRKYIDQDLIKTIIEGEELGINALREIRLNLIKFENIELIDQIIKENEAILNELNKIKSTVN